MAKAAPKKAAPAKSGGAMVKWDEQLAQYAKDTTAKIALPTGKFMSLKGGKLAFGGAAIPGNELNCIVIGWTYEHQYYEGDYDPDVAQSPVCYAFGTDKDEMAPKDNVPEKQNDACADCPLNQYESAPRGKGKACKNVMRLALITEDELEDVSSAEVVYLKIPVMSVRNFEMYAKNIADTAKRPYWAMVTTISVEDDSKSQFRVVFEAKEKVEDGSLFEPLKTLWEKTMKGIDFPYVVQEKEAKPAKKAVNKNAKFAKRR